MKTWQGKRIEPVNGELWLKELEYGKDPRDSILEDWENIL